MNLVRLFVIGVLIWIAYHFLKGLLANPPSARGGSTSAGKQIGTMVRCEYCGLHVPESEAINAAGHRYCSAEHRDRAQRH